MKEVLMLTLVALAAASPPSHLLDLDALLESDKIIKAVNSAETTWKGNIKHFLGLKRRPEGSRLPPLMEYEEDENLELPETFDARQKWSKCISLQEVRDQGPCGSCWAVAAAAVFTDRLCIATNAQFNGHLSAQDLLSCCSYCGDGCDGGSDDLAWQYFQDTGICTGGDYDSNEGCQPYTLPPCEHHVSGPRKNCSDFGIFPTPKCQKSCYNKNYKYNTKVKDLYRVKSAFTIFNDVKKAQKEIFKNGPLQAGFHVYKDFENYKTGVYQHKSGAHIAGHAVKVVGWGTENGTPYWLAANSWNTDWGEKGFFKIRRGNNECGFEDEFSGGYVYV